MRRIIASIDFGTNSIKVVVGEIVKTKLNILSAASTLTMGIKKGIITDLEKCVESLKRVLKKSEDMLGLKIAKAIVTIPSYSAEFTIGEGSSTITNPDKVITGVDILMAMQASMYNKIPNNMELITVIPTVYRIDNDTMVKNPKGIVANKLSVKTVIVTTPKRNVYSILRLCEGAGIKVMDIALGSIGDYYTNKTIDTDNTVGTIINLGDETTTVSIFNKGVLTNTEVIDLGGRNVDNDISFIYKIDKKEAKRLKEDFTLFHKRLASPGEVEVVKNNMGEDLRINQFEISEIVMSRLQEILNLAKKQINLLTKKEISYIILTGGLSEAKDFNLILEEVFGHNAIIGNVNITGVRDNKYSTCVGLIKYFNDRLNLKDKEFSIFTKEELEELVNTEKGVNISENTVLGKIFGYFFDN